MKLCLGAVVYFALAGLTACSSDDSGVTGDGAGPGEVAHDAGGGDATVGPGSKDAAGDATERDVAQAADTSTGGDAAHDAGADATDAGHAADASDAAAADATSDADDAGSSAGDDGGDAGVVDGDLGDASDGSSDDGGAIPDPIGKWSFEDDSGTTAADLSGHGHPATLMGGAAFTASGKIGSGLALDGTSAYADVGTTLIDTTKSFTVSCWVSLATTNAWEAALSEDDVNGSLFGLKLRGDGSNQFDFDVETSDVMSPGFAVAQSTTKAQASTWTHLAGVYDASGKGALVVYVNGAPEARTAVGQPLAAAQGHLLIGRGLYNAVTGSFLHGVIDEVEVRDVALSDAQVAALYAATK